MRLPNLYHFTWRFYLFHSLGLLIARPFLFSKAFLAPTVEPGVFFECNKKPAVLIRMAGFSLVLVGGKSTFRYSRGNTHQCIRPFLFLQAELRVVVRSIRCFFAHPVARFPQEPGDRHGHTVPVNRMLEFLPCVKGGLLPFHPVHQP